ncbi:MAG: hypothetical protein ACRCUT_05435 [Spirochaetota bacterium]
MKKAGVFLFLFLCAAPVSADYLFLSDGSIIECRIVKQKAMSVKVKRSDGRVVTILGYDILRVRTQKTWKEKIFVHAEDDRLYPASLVEEKGDVYIFRKDISRPEEFSLNKARTRILTEKISSVPEAALSGTKISVSWKEIPGAVSCNIYFRTGRGDFLRAGNSAAGPFITEKKMKGNTRYGCVITAVFPDGSESAPSAESFFVTGNNPPLPPDSLFCAVESAPEGRGGIASLSWDGDSDEDGLVEKYNVFIRENGGYRQIGQTFKRSLSVPVSDSSGLYTFAVSSVDDTGAESAYSRDFLSRDVFRFSYSLEGIGIYPVLSMADTASYGGGALFSIFKDDIFIKGVSAGFAAGVLYISGAHGAAKTDAFPLLLRTAYCRFFSSRFGIEAAVRGGMWYYSTLEQKEPPRHNLKPCAEAYLSGIIRLNPRISVRIGAGYGSFYSKGSYMQYAGGSAGTIFQLEM